jgi:pyruvate-formate lyase-activating enzyme
MPESARQQIPLLDMRKFRDPVITAKGERRATVALRALETLWINTGTLCNLTCQNCYIESSPSNNRLVYMTASEVAGYLDEIRHDGLPTKVIGFTGGEPFMNPDLLQMLEDALARGFEVLVLTNAMKPMAKCHDGLLALRHRYGARLAVRVSVDHYGPAVHEIERGRRSWRPTLDGLKWLSTNGFRLDVATRGLSGESEAAMRAGFARLFAEHNIAIDADDPVRLMVFPEMDARVDVPEITEACWGILHKTPDDVMCSSSRMVVKRKGAEAPAVVACTLLPYDQQFELGRTLGEAGKPVALNHPHCAKFCVLGGAACSR